MKSGQYSILHRSWINLLLFEVVDDSQCAILGNHGQMTIVRRNGKGVDSLVGDFPGCHRVGLLILGVNRLLNLHLRNEVKPIGWSLAILAALWLLVLGSEDGILLLLVIYDNSAVHMSCQEEVFGSRNPSDLGDWRLVDHALKYVSLLSRLADGLEGRIHSYSAAYIAGKPAPTK